MVQNLQAMVVNHTEVLVATVQAVYPVVSTSARKLQRLLTGLMQFWVSTTI